MDRKAPNAPWVPRMRSAEEIEYMLQWLQTLKGPLTPTFLRGARDTLLWVLGRGGVSPITGKVLPQPIRYGDVSREANEATTAMYNGGLPPRPIGTPRPEPLPAGYLQGVEHMAMWVTGSDTLGHPEHWPFPTEAAALSRDDPRW